MTEATLQDYEEGLQACSEAAKTWMTVSFLFLKKEHFFNTLFGGVIFCVLVTW